VLPAGGPQFPGRHHREARGNAQFEPVACALACQRRLAARGVAGDIAGDEYRLRAGPDDLGHWLAVPDHQVAAPGAQPRAQIGEALQHEAGPVRRGHQPGVHGE
jgi:hypothetical protein